MQIEAAVQNLIHLEQQPCIVSSQHELDALKENGAIQELKVFADNVIGHDSATGKGCDTIKNGQGVTQGTIRFFRDGMQGLFFRLNALFIRHKTQMVRNILQADTLEVKNLASRQNGREHLVLLRGR